MMPGFLQTFARVLPLYYVNEGLRAAMVFADNLTALWYSAVIGVFATVVFIVGILTTKWEEGK
jgi:ABC-2 type transport system permease protein